MEQQLGRTRGGGHDTAEKNNDQEHTADHRGQAESTTILVRPRQTTGITGAARRRHATALHMNKPSRPSHNDTQGGSARRIRPRVPLVWILRAFTHNILNTFLFGFDKRPSALLKADAELRIEGSSYRPHSAYTRTAVHRTSARLPLHDRPSECVNQLPPFAPRIRSANSIGPLRTLHQGQQGDRRGPLRATADWRGTDSDLDRIAA